MTTKENKERTQKYIRDTELELGEAVADSLVDITDAQIESLKLMLLERDMTHEKRRSFLKVSREDYDILLASIIRAQVRERNFTLK